jgi:RHS repeat-associated protein
VIQREYTGRAVPDQPTTSTQNRPTGKLRASDPAFFETVYEWNNQYSRTRTGLPNGNEIVSFYESDLSSEASPLARGNLRAQIRRPGSQAETPDQPSITEIFEYTSGLGSGCCAQNFVSRHIDGRGNITLNDHDGAGNRTRMQDRIPAIEHDYEYNSFGQFTAHVWPDNGSGHRRRDEKVYYASGSSLGYLQQKIIDATGEQLITAYEYDLVGNVTRVTDPRGNDKQYVYNELDQVVREISRAVELPAGSATFVRYEKDFYYDANDNLVRIDVQHVDDQGVVGGTSGNTHFTTIFEYGILNHLIRTCDEAGSFAVPGAQLDCTSLPDSEFLTTEFEYDANRNRTLVRLGEAVEARQPDNVVQSLYDERDLLFQEVRAPGHADQSTRQHDYDKNGNLVQILAGIEDTAHVTAHAYDGYDRRVKTTDPMGNVFRYSYDANSNLVAVRADGELVDAPGNGTPVRLAEAFVTYDELDRRTQVARELFDVDTQAPLQGGQVLGQAVTDWLYSDNSQILQRINDNLHPLTAQYDTVNRIASITDAKSNRYDYTYDDNSNVVARLDTEKPDLGGPDELFTTSLNYDGIDRWVEVVDNVGNTRSRAYDSRGNRTLHTDALSNRVRFDYDGVNRPIATIRDLDQDGPDGDGPDITTTQSWDDSFRRTGRADDLGNLTAHTYDPLDRWTVTTYADGTQDSTIYDAHDNPLSKTDANGTVSTCTFDLLDRLTSRAIAPGLGVSADTTFELYQFDGLSRLVSAQDDDSLVTRSFDSLFRVTQEVLNGQTTTSSYDGVGNPLQCTYPGGRVISCTFDELERKKTVDDVTNLMSPWIVATYDYVGPSRVARKDLGNNTRTTYAYDGITGVPNPAGDFGVREIIGTTHVFDPGGAATLLDDRTYSWDAVYRKSERRDVRSGGPELTHDFSYDDAYRLVFTDITDGLGAGVRTTTYTLDGVGSRLQVSGQPDPGMYTCDSTMPEPADCSMNQYTATPFDTRVHDKNGNLIQLDTGLPGQVDVRYDFQNRMVEYQDGAGGPRHTYSYDALGRRIARVVDADGASEETRYFYDGWQVLEEQDGAAQTMATNAYGGGIDEVLTLQHSGADFFYHCDDLASVTALSDMAGNVVERYEYGDYGAPLDPVTLAPINGTPSSVGNSYFFTGRRHDGETGWHHYRTRYLDSLAGRFIVRDRIGLWGDADNLGNAFAYVGNQPATLVDPFGLDPLPKGFKKGAEAAMKRHTRMTAKIWQQYQEKLDQWNESNRRFKVYCRGAEDRFREKLKRKEFDLLTYELLKLTEQVGMLKDPTNPHWYKEWRDQLREDVKIKTDALKNWKWYNDRRASELRRTKPKPDPIPPFVYDPYGVRD